MNLKECYDALGGSYDEALGRLQREMLVKKFVLKFLDDGSFSLLESALQAKNYEEAFRGAHTLKGVCSNLAFDRLFESSNQMSELFKKGLNQEAEALMPQVAADYKQTVDAIRAFQDSEG